MLQVRWEGGSSIQADRERGDRQDAIQIGWLGVGLAEKEGFEVGELF